MENLFDLLIILFIIYAFLAPLFKVLKKKPTPTQTKPESYQTETYSEVEPEKSSQDILREIEKLFGYETKEPEPIEESKDEEFYSFEPEPITYQRKIEPKFEEQVVQITPSQIKKEDIHQEFIIEAYDYEATIPETDIDEFDYSKLDVYEIEMEDKSQIEKTFTLELSGIDDFKKAVIYKEIFDTPIALRMRRIKWQRNIY